MHFLHGEVTFTDPRSLHVNAEFRKQMTSMFLDVLAREKQQAPEKYNEFWELYRDQVLEGIAVCRHLHVFSLLCVSVSMDLSP